MKKDIWCTLGPSSLNNGVIKRLEDLGITVFRVNLSHTNISDLSKTIEIIRNVTDVPICLDTEGPQIRTGSMKNGRVELVEDSIIKICKNRIPGDDTKFNLYPHTVFNQLKVDDILQIDHDSALVKIVGQNSSYAKCRVLNGGNIGQNKAVDIKRSILMDSLTPKDYKAINIGIKCGIEYFAISFCESKHVIENVRSLVGRDKFIIAKIESIGGLNSINEIIDESDAILLDRGDLSRQVSIERIPPYQKQIITRSNERKTPVFVATNLLESMIHNLFPTRAEVSDVYNTLDDGADGLVLAAETAIGNHPVQSAVIISNIIKQYINNKKITFDITFENSVNSYSTGLVEPHGGYLINRVICEPDLQELNSLKTLSVSIETLLDIEQIAIGAYSPLQGFMNKDEIQSVLEFYRLPNGEIWPLPIFLQVKKDLVSKFEIGDRINIIHNNDNIIYATLEIDEIFQYDLDSLTKNMFSTLDENHPGVYRIKQGEDIFLSGKVSLIKYLPNKHKYYFLTPYEVREIFYYKGWNRVVGFHTRNIPHRAHEYIQTKALEDYYCDGLFLHPIIGPKKSGDYSSDILLNSYQILIDNDYLDGRTLLGSFNNYSRYCGSREAVFTALCRKNYGCSHFIIGRDHTGLDDYYSNESIDELFQEIGDIGITPIIFDNIYYNNSIDSYTTINDCDSDDDNLINISGTEARGMLKKGVLPPEWYMRKELSRAIIDEIMKDKIVFEK